MEAQVGSMLGVEVEGGAAVDVGRAPGLRKRVMQLLAKIRHELRPEAAAMATCKACKRTPATGGVRCYRCWSADLATLLESEECSREESDALAAAFCDALHAQAAVVDEIFGVVEQQEQRGAE